MAKVNTFPLFSLAFSECLLCEYDVVKEVQSRCGEDIPVCLDTELSDAAKFDLEDQCNLGVIQ